MRALGPSISEPSTLLHSPRLVATNPSALADPSKSRSTVTNRGSSTARYTRYRRTPDWPRWAGSPSNTCFQRAKSATGCSILTVYIGFLQLTGRYVLANNILSRCHAPVVTCPPQLHARRQYAETRPVTFHSMRLTHSIAL